MGNCPGRQAAEIWFELSLRIEDAMYFGTSLSGCVGDVVKAFNCLPRVPVFLMARHLRLPLPLINTWHAAVAGVRRHFVVDGATGPPLSSTTGFPEGDPLSVVAMFLLNVAFHQYMDHSLDTVTTWSYVDNWETSGTFVDDVSSSPNQMIKFAEMLDLQLDVKKLFAWSTDATSRRLLRDNGLVVQHHARDLGGHMCYSKQNTCYTIKGRLASLTSFWLWVRRSMAPTYQKNKLLQAVAWPRCLHGIETIWIGEQHFVTLRASAMKALGFDYQGASSFLQFSLFQDCSSDPAFFALVRTVKMFRKLVVPHIAYPILSHLADYAPLRYFQGPCGTLLRRLHEVGWRWDGDGFFLDHQLLRLHIVHSPIQLLISRLKHAWSFFVGSKISQRAEFSGLESVDAKFSTYGIDKLSLEKQGFARTAMNGTFFTRDKQSKAGTLPDDLCVWCQQPDSISHRYWSCCHFHQSRNLIPEEHRAQILNLPVCTNLHGWWQESELVPHLFRALQCLPDSTGDFLISPPDQEIQHLFSDGSCLCPHSHVLKLATWGVVAANLPEDAFCVVSQGVVPGILQSSLRAEILGATSAFKFGLSSRNPFWLWCDNQQVVDFIEATINDNTQVSVMQKDHDLWMPLQHLIQRAFRATIFQKILKISSHQGEQRFTQHVERWAFKGNEQADFAAENARQLFPVSLQAIWEQLEKQQCNQAILREQLRGHFLRVAEIAISHKQDIRKYDTTVWDSQLAQNPPEVAIADISFYNWAERFLTLEDNDVHVLLYDWLKDLLTTPCDDREHIWLSSYQLLLDFQRVTGHVGFRRHNRKCAWYDATSWVKEHDYDFLFFSRNFQVCLKTFANHYGYPFHVQLRRPGGELFQCWTKCTCLMVSRCRILSLDLRLRSLGIGLIKRVQKSFAVIKEWPLAA